MKWSFSADRCFRRCQRQYLFRNIVACHNAKKAPERREAFLLTQLKSLDQWRGLSVHDGIKAFAVPRWEAGEPIDWDEVTDHAVAMGRRQLAFSAARRYREEGVTKTKFPLEYCALLDHEDGGSPSPAAVRAAFAEQVSRWVLTLKKAQGPSAPADEALGEARAKLADVVEQVLGRLGQEQPPAGEAAPAVPEEVFERLEARRRSEADWFIQDLQVTISALREGIPLDPRGWKILDEVGDAADAAASASFRRLWRR